MTKPCRALGLLLALAATGCNSDDSSAGAAGIGTPITCAWFAGDNCWKRSAAEANACIESGTTGTLGSDWLSCSYASGTQIRFATSPADAMKDGYVWDFDITADGTNCASYTDFGNDSGFSLTTASGEFKEEIVGMQMNFTCPSGERVTIGAFESLNCLMQGLPGTAWSNSDNFASFSFIGMAEQHELFNCETAP